MNVLAMIVLILFAPALLEAEVNNDRLLDELHIPDGWNIVEGYSDGSLYYEKNIPELNLKAVKIYKHVELYPENIVEVLTDVEAYNDFLVSLDALRCYKLTESEDSIYGYQYISTKLVSDRHYVFRMYKPYTLDSGDIRLDWVFEPRDSINTEIKAVREIDNKNIVFTDTGAGSWLFEKVSDSLYRISYRLCLDPGGWIPGFLIDKTNKKSLLNLFNDVLNEAKQRNGKRN